MATRVLSLRGGSIRGYATAILLAELERRTGKQCADIFDLIVGTSAGGIIATALALKITAAQVVEFFLDEGPIIFKARPFARHLLMLGHPRYKIENLIAALDRHFLPDTLLAHVFTKLMLTSTRYRGDESRLWKSWKHTDLRASLAAASSAAAMTYFAPVVIGGFEYGDGGYWCNNPSCCAVVEARKLWPTHSITLIDIACPSDKSQYEPKAGGILDVVPHMANIFIGAGEDGMSYIANHLLGGGKMLSIEPPLLDASQDIGDATKGNLERLKRCAEYGLERNVDAVISALRMPLVP